MGVLVYFFSLFSNSKLLPFSSSCCLFLSDLFQIFSMFQSGKSTGKEPEESSKKCPASRSLCERWSKLLCMCALWRKRQYYWRNGSNHIFLDALVFMCHFYSFHVATCLLLTHVECKDFMHSDDLITVLHGSWTATLSVEMAWNSISQISIRMICGLKFLWQKWNLSQYPQDFMTIFQIVT